jgi:hypothetical protein
VKGITQRIQFFPVMIAAVLGLATLTLPQTAEAGRRRTYSTSTLKISGTPAASVVVGATYSFAPTVVSSASMVSYSFSGVPAWATKSIATGTISGTPTSAAVGTYSNIIISVSDGTKKVSLAPFSITVQAAQVTATTPPATTTNTAPVITGTAPGGVLAGSAYSFQPTASDANGDALTFSIANAPSWAAFSTSTGRITGTPSAAQVGTYSAIVVTVSDGKTTTSLPAFSVTVNAVVLGSATLSWTPPTQNSDGSALVDLSGYNVYYGTSSTTMTNKVAITNPGLTSYLVGNLGSGTYYFAITAYSSTGAESAMSSVGSKTVL